MQALPVAVLKEMLDAPDGVWPARNWALFDIREPGEADAGHIGGATCLPRRQIEIRIADLVPAKGTRIVVYDENGARAELAARTLAALGYEHAAYLDGGLRAWQAAGLPVVTGTNLPCKRFAEEYLAANPVPYIDAKSLDARIKSGERLVICDVRTPVEFQGHCLPNAFSTPSFDLALHVFGLGEQYDTIVVNCAGRTRSILGAGAVQLLGIDKVYALENGTMGWTVAGLEVERGAHRTLPAPSASSIAAGEAAAARLAASTGIAHIAPEELEALMAQRGSAMVYLFDVRPLEEYKAGHIEHAIALPGGQAAQRVDDFTAVPGAEIVFVDEIEARAMVTAFWYRAMGFPRVRVLAGGMRAWAAAGRKCLVGRGRTESLGLEAARQSAAMLDARALSAWLAAHPAAVVIDVGTSKQFKKAHLPGAKWVKRGSLELDIGALAAKTAPIAVAGPDTIQAIYAAATMRGLGYGNVVGLTGGPAEWRAAGYDVATGIAGYEGQDNELWQPPYEKGKGAVLEYLEWETKLGHEGSHAGHAA
jgi:rhodanese-related sulfurtransferase